MRILQLINKNQLHEKDTIKNSYTMVIVSNCQLLRRMNTADDKAILHFRVKFHISNLIVVETRSLFVI